MFSEKHKAIKKLLVIVITFVAVITAAYFLGVEAGGFLNANKKEESKIKSEKFKQFLLERIENLTVGQKLPNFFFRDLDGNLVELEKLVQSTALITYFVADCHSCIEELELIIKQSQSERTKPFWVLVSHSNPFELKELQARYKIEFPILYDHWNQYGSNLKIDTYPFNILVDSGLTIRQLIPGELLEDEYKEVMTIVIKQ